MTNKPEAALHHRTAHSHPGCLAIARIEKYLLGFLPYGRQPLGGARVATVEVGRFGGLVAHFRVVLNDMLDTCESDLGTSSQMHVPASPEE